MDENIKEEQLAPSPHEQIISIQERMKILENQIREIESDLPQNLSKSILNMKKNIQMVTEQSNLQSDYQAPYVYSEVLEKIGDFQRRVEWKLKDVIQNKLFDIDLKKVMNFHMTKRKMQQKNSTIKYLVP